MSEAPKGTLLFLERITRLAPLARGVSCLLLAKDGRYEPRSNFISHGTQCSNSRLNIRGSPLLRKVRASFKSIPKQKDILSDVFLFWSGLRGSNSLPPPWQGGALPDELNPHISAAAFAATVGASGRNRTNDTGIFSPLLYQLSYRGRYLIKWRPGRGSNPRPLA